VTRRQPGPVQWAREEHDGPPSSVMVSRWTLARCAGHQTAWHPRRVEELGCHAGLMGPYLTTVRRRPAGFPSDFGGRLPPASVDQPRRKVRQVGNDGIRDPASQVSVSSAKKICAYMIGRFLNATSYRRVSDTFRPGCRRGQPGTRKLVPAGQVHRQPIVQMNALARSPGRHKGLSNGTVSTEEPCEPPDNSEGP
jgi:hypothetical protein